MNNSIPIPWPTLIPVNPVVPCKSPGINA
jgi:hypothetical protein